MRAPLLSSRHRIFELRHLLKITTVPCTKQNIIHTNHSMATAPLVAAIFFSILFANKIFRIHTMHSRFWEYKQRTNTNAQIRFERLQRYWLAGRNGVDVWSDKDVVNFDFGDSEQSHIIELPIGSTWQTCEHTHLTKDMCLQIETLAGGSLAVHIGGSPGLPFQNKSRNSCLLVEWVLHGMLRLHELHVRGEPVS